MEVYVLLRCTNQLAFTNSDFESAADAKEIVHIYANKNDAYAKKDELDAEARRAQLQAMETEDDACEVKIYYRVQLCKVK